MQPPSSETETAHVIILKQEKPGSPEQAAGFVCFD
jgi:hypothetical protein